MPVTARGHAPLPSMARPPVQPAGTRAAWHHAVAPANAVATLHLERRGMNSRYPIGAAKKGFAKRQSGTCALKND